MIVFPSACSSAPVASPPSEGHDEPLTWADAEVSTEPSGALLGRVTGGGLTTPIDVPSWLEPSEVEGVPTRLGWFELPGRRWYLHQSGPGGGTPCRVLDATARAFDAAPACAETAFLTSTFETVRPGVAVARSWGEGCGQIEIVTWSDDAGAAVAASRSLGCAGGVATWSRDGDGVVIRASCDLDREGCPEPTQADPTYVWTPKAGLHRR